MQRILFALAALLALAPISRAQTANVRAWYAKGQVFVVWQNLVPPAAPTDTVEIYSSPAAQVSTANMTLIGRMFFPEYTGARLQELQPNARLQIPTPLGGTYRLAANEGVFAYTPRAAGVLFFAAVNTGTTTVNAANSTSTLFDYDPVNDPVVPHLQFNGFTPGNYPYSAYVVFADGSDDYDSARPDIPVIASAEKNGVPHVFTITRPRNALPPGPRSCVFAMHGGGGEFELFRPGVPARANLSLELTSGIVVSPDDSIFYNDLGALTRSNTSWFGYTPDFDPFTNLVRNAPAPPSVAVNFTQRRIHWILDWLLSPSSPLQIDPLRVAMIGHSGGGRGTSHLTRLRPERFCAAVIYTPASDLGIPPGGRENILYGNWDDNLETNVPGPDGTPLGTTDLFTMTTRVSTLRDFTLTRIYYGKRDEEGPATWSPSQRAIIDSLNASRQGAMIFWDEREHGVEKWDNETNDATDAHAGPWPDVGQWIAPVRTRRASCQELVRFAPADLSYPGFFNTDADPLLPGAQPDPGPGDPDLGAPYGTWGGWLNWDPATILDTTDRYEITLFAEGLSVASIDNSPYASFITDLAPRRTLNFNPASGTLVNWRAVDLATNALLQSGQSVAESDSLVVVSGLVVPRDPARIRLLMCRVPGCTGDANNNGVVTFADVTTVLANFNADYAPCSGPGDADRNGTVNFADVTSVLANLANQCP